VKKHRILPEAVAEIERASVWYEREREGLGTDLLAEFRERLKFALQMPHTGALAGTTPSGAIIRRFRLTRFSRYAILIAEIDGTATVLAFEHSSRRPRYWRSRVE